MNGLIDCLDNAFCHDATRKARGYGYPLPPHPHTLPPPQKLNGSGRISGTVFYGWGPQLPTPLLPLIATPLNKSWGRLLMIARKNRLTMGLRSTPNFGGKVIGSKLVKMETWATL